MKLEDQVTSLELSKKLKELGVKQESLFNWNIYDESVPKLQEQGNFGGAPKDMSPYLVSAFTSAELGEVLKPVFRNSIDTYYTDTKQWRVYAMEGLHKFGSPFGDIRFGEFDSDTEVDARAKMLIYLIENKLCEIGS